MKATLVIYDGLFELDRTEITYTDERQLREIARAVMADSPGSEYCEVYNSLSLSLVAAYNLSRKGTLTERAMPKRKGRGGWRPGSEKNFGPPRPRIYKADISLPMTEQMLAALEPLGRTRAAYIRQAIAQRLEREGNPLPPDPYPKAEGHPDRRYHRMFKNLPPNVKTYDGKRICRSPLTITRTPDAWRVSYGQYTDLPGAPSVETKDLLSALERMRDWLDRYHGKWIVGKVAEDPTQ